MKKKEETKSEEEEKVMYVSSKGETVMVRKVTADEPMQKHVRFYAQGEKILTEAAKEDRRNLPNRRFTRLTFVPPRPMTTPKKKNYSTKVKGSKKKSVIRSWAREWSGKTS